MMGMFVPGYICRKSRFEMMKFACPPTGEFSGVGGGHFRTPIVSLISYVTSTTRRS